MTNTNYPSATPQNQPPAKGNGTKNIIIGVLAVGLLGSWGYYLMNKSKTDDQIQEKSMAINSAMSAKDSVQTLYSDALVRLDSITGQNNNLQGEKSALQKDIDAKKAEIRRILNDSKATKADLARAKTMIAELNGKISEYEAEITRLTGENQELTASNTVLTQEKADLTQNLQSTTTEKEELAKTVDVASTFSASNIQITPVDERRSGKEKTTSTAKRVDKLVVSFDVENRIAKSGAADMYIIVTAPDGKVITKEGMMLSTRADGEKSYTEKVAVDYTQGTRKPVQFPIRNNDFATGDYKIEIYHNGFKIGEGVRSLKKGGLFG
jgi:hypothetical protein